MSKPDQAAVAADKIFPDSDWSTAIRHLAVGTIREVYRPLIKAARLVCEQVATPIGNASDQNGEMLWEMPVKHWFEIAEAAEALRELLPEDGK